MKQLLWLLPLAFAFTGCGGPPTAPTPETIMPLKIGNSWVGRTTLYDYSGHIADITYDTLTIIERVAIDGEFWFRTNTGLLLTNRPDGLWQDCEADSCSPRLRAKFPAQINDRFDSGDSIVGQPSKQHVQIASYIVSRDTAIMVPAGDYPCYHYQPKVSSSIYNPVPLTSRTQEYFAPGVGPVKIQTAGLRPKSWELVQTILN